MPLTRSKSEKSALPAEAASSASITAATTNTATTNTPQDKEPSAAANTEERSDQPKRFDILPASPSTENVAPEVSPTSNTNNEDAATLRPSSKAMSRRSRHSRLRRVAELELQERRAQIELKEVQAAAKLEKARIELLQAGLSSSDEEIEEDHEMTVQRVDMWFERQNSPSPRAESRHPSPLRPSAHPSARSSARSSARHDCAGQLDAEPRALKQASPPHTSNGSNIATLASAITEAARISSRQPPKYLVELPLYSGKADEWLSFKATFTQTQDSFTPAENIARLRRSVKGAALEAVSALLITQAHPNEIIKALERRFGRPEALVIAEMDKMKTLPRVTDNPRDLCIFANKVANIVAAVEVLKRPQYLHSPEMLRLAVEKLPPIIKNKWYDYASSNIEDKPELKKLTTFLNCEADKCAAYALPETEHERPARKRIERTYVADNKREAGCPLCKAHHALPECPQFLSADVNSRWEITKTHKMCFRCLRSTHRRVVCRARVCGQGGCTLRHHKLLHLPKKPDVAEIQPQQPQVTEEVLTSTIETTNASNGPTTHRRAYLKVAQVTIIGPQGSRDTYALLDEGSTVSIIDAQLAASIGLDGPIESMTVQGVNGDEMKHEQSKRVSAMIKGKYENEVHQLRDARTVDSINFFTQSVRARDIENCRHIEDIKSELTYENATPKILIGQDNWELIVTRSVRDGSRNQPVASSTHLGWVLHGCRTSLTYPVVFCAHLNTAERAHDRLEEMMKKHFELESLGIEARVQGSDPEQQALNLLEKKSHRLPDGRFETGLLWRDENAKIPNNYEDTLKRLQSLEKKLDRDEALKRKYEERVGNLLHSNYAERVTAPPTGGKTWYLPHFAVVNPEKKKIRLVHDAAAKSHGRSLNDMLLPGPDLLQSLPGVIMKFREHPIAVSSDIKEMFMQVKIVEEDRDALRFLWRGDRRNNAPPEEYRMTSLIFGATSSPCTALYIKNKNAQEYALEHPAAARAIQENHYMDDYLHSFTSLEEAKKITAGVDRLHKKAGFELRGWASNDARAIQHFTREGVAAARGGASETVEIGGNDIEKTLGLLWYVKEDTLGFRVNKKRVPPEVLQGLREPTKREALSLIMSIFDPLGLISPITTPAKRIMQDTWKYKTEWDDPIPTALLPRWITWLEKLHYLHLLRVPRCYDYTPAATREMHTFVDASEEAYVAAVYLRAKRADGSVNVAIIAAKSRVTPTKPVSIPRLELQAAVMGARLAKSVENGHDFDFDRKTYWSDSRTALSWIRAEPRTYKTFVAHRLAEIEDITKKEEWRWVPTSMNVADDSTRDTPADLSPQHRWYTGPDFLYQDEDAWPTEVKQHVHDTGEEREICSVQHGASNIDLIDFSRFSKYSRLLRTMGRVLQFIELCRSPILIAAGRHKRTKKNAETDETWQKYTKRQKEAKRATPAPLPARKMLPLKAHLLYAAERLMIRLAQSQSYCEKERSQALSGGAATRNGPLAGLSVMQDGENILRLRGRVNEAEAIDYETANPAILDGRHRYTKLYIQHVHEKLHHGGVEAVVNELRQRLWIVRIRPAVKEVLKSCPRCRLRKAKPASPSTGDLPPARLAHHERPFTYTGLDYFGPLEVTVSRHREKRYVALFTCMTSRAVHLEVVTSLSTGSAINALRRFIARRGCPTELWSDNATCFKSADRELKEAWRALEKEATERRINWRFLPPAAPFMAGAWERMVRTVKEALRVTLNEQRPSDETLNTLLAEVEATVNSRPLTHVAVTPDAPPALTPNAILLGPNCYIPSPGKFEDTDANARAHWRRAQHLADVFWRRWVREYLPLLQHRREPHASGTAPKIGDLVVICDSNLPRNTWPRGKVTAVYPGKDGEVRVIDVTTSSGRVMRRPTKRVVVLPV